MGKKIISQSSATTPEQAGTDAKRLEVAIYARVSSAEQANEGVSIEAQVAALRAYAKSQGWEVVEEYIDGGHSGGTDDRPALRRLINDAGQGRFSITAVCKLDRFFRNLRLLLNYLHDFERLGIRFLSIQEGLDTSTPYGKFAMQMMGVIAEFERGRIGERVKDSRQYLIARGQWPGGRTIYGYRWLAEEKKWEIDENEARVVRYIYDLYLNERLGTMKIPFRLNEEGYCTRLGYRWNFSAVYQVLSHPGYKGKHPQGFEMPVIINEETWELAQIKRRQARRIRNSGRPWVLQGRCVCGECGRVLGCQQKDATERRYYACQGRYKDSHLDGSPRCKLPRINADMLETAVWECLKVALTDSETLKESVRTSLARDKERREQLCQDAGLADKRIEAIAAKKERLGLVFADGAITVDTYQKKLQELVRIEKDLLKARDNLSPEAWVEIEDLEHRIKYLEARLNSKSSRVLLTEIGVFTFDPREIKIVGGIPIWETDEVAYNYREPEKLKIEELGLSWIIVDRPETCNVEISGDIIKRNIRDTLDRLDVKVYIFWDRIEIRGFMPTEIIELPERADTSGRGAIIGSARG